MGGQIIMTIICFICASIIFAIGVYARKLEKPMWFYSGSEVDPAKITDVKQYNRENALMWQRYSLWFFAAGLAEFWNGIAAVTFLVGGCTVGVGLLVYSYHKIYKKYQVR